MCYTCIVVCEVCIGVLCGKRGEAIEKRKGAGGGGGGAGCCLRADHGMGSGYMAECSASR